MNFFGWYSDRLNHGILSTLHGDPEIFHRERRLLYCIYMELLSKSGEQQGVCGDVM